MTVLLAVQRLTPSCNSGAQDRKKKNEQLMSCTASNCTAEEQQLPHGYMSVRPESLPDKHKGSSSHRASLHQARRCSWQCRHSSRNPHGPAAVHGPTWQTQGWILYTETWVAAMTDIFFCCLSDINVKSHIAFGRGRAGTLHSIRWVAEYEMHITWKLSSTLVFKGDFGKFCHSFHLHRWIKKDTCK